jgi:hypothetical protein
MQLSQRIKTVDRLVLLVHHRPRIVGAVSIQDNLICCLMVRLSAVAMSVVVKNAVTPLPIIMLQPPFARQPVCLELACRLHFLLRYICA